METCFFEGIMKESRSPKSGSGGMVERVKGGENVVRMYCIKNNIFNLIIIIITYSVAFVFLTRITTNTLILFTEVGKTCTLLLIV